MKKRILVIEKINITHAIDVEVFDEKVIDEIIETLECDRLEDFDDAVSRLGDIENVEVEGIEKEYDYGVKYDYGVNDIEIKTTEVD